ncbi:hypothetical protein ABZ135_19170 [Streptomyces sp. NPDC006339]|uniref:hypothetical protein n=1 Tax=Streptomyces sp. NPDC006339 TaxID=3156755 RepID=UPI0033BAC349
MLASLLPHGVPPWAGALRAVRAGVLAVLCVLLPVGGHALLQGHTPRLLVLVVEAALAVPLYLVLTRRRLADTQLLAAFAGAQAAYHVCYVVPGACAALTDRPSGGHLAGLTEHAAAGPGPPVLLGGHAVTLLLAARLLGTTESLLLHARPLTESAQRILHALLPLLTAIPAGHGPLRTPATEVAPLRPTALAYPCPGRAPPTPVVLPNPFRPPAVTGFRLAA